MLICPQCHFQNPNNNKFCQKCGTSLTYKICPDCGSKVPFFQENCQTCSATIGTIWWAVISKKIITQTVTVEVNETEPAGVYSLGADTLVEEQIIDEEIDNLAGEAEELSLKESEQTEVQAEQMDLVGEVENTISVDSEQATASSYSEEFSNKKTDELQIDSYLDYPQNRYRILDPLPEVDSHNIKELVSPICVRVLDCQPLQTTVLGALIEQQKSSTTPIEPPITIPAIAQVYLALQTQLYPALPKIHEAWQQDGQEVVLLEDRSQSQTLVSLWNNEQVPLFQILYWLSEIVKLWAALEPYKCRQSLLEVKNLRVDEDQTMCLQQLYPDPQDSTLTLQELGQVWQTLFQESQRTQFKSLEELFRDLREGSVQKIEELRSRLEAIADEFESTSKQAIAGAKSVVPGQTFIQIPSTTMPGSESSTSTSQSINSSDKTAEGNDGDDFPTVVLPMQLLSLEEAGYTDIGRQRNHNEDFFGIDTQIRKQENALGRTIQARGLYILCDGMGGHASGEVASAMAVETINRYFQANWRDRLPDEASIREAVRLANMEIYNTNQQNARSGSGRMGTTLVMVLIQDTDVAIAHVGDSRLYRISRRRGLEQLTIDHEVGQREIQRGVESSLAYSRPDAYQLTQALGPRDEHLVNPDVQFVELNEDSLLLLCSDGLSDNELLENHWQTHLLPLLSSRANLEQGVQQLIDLANQHNGHDNITAVLIRAKVRPNLEQAQML